MASERKITILYWVVAILAVFNLSLLATILFFPKVDQDKTEEGGPRTEKHQPGDQRHYISRTLNLTPSQEVYFDSSRHQFFREADTVFKALRQCKQDIYKELSSANPDSVKLNELATKMGSLHTQLKISTIRHFMKLRTECTPEQQMKLSEIFGRMINNQGGFQGGFQGGERRLRESRKPVPGEDN
ncbi:MAG: periplasmic heavy metal sensor [Bacteroidales bacterium]